jgi:hypothetical protein
MRILAVLLLVYVVAPSPIAAQKMSVRIVSHRIGGQEYSRYVPGVALNNGNATANCGAYGNTANCSGSANGSSVYVPAHVVTGYIKDIDMVLLLPDGRKVHVGCEDRLRTMWKGPHYCKNPTTDDAEADFSGREVKLKWVVGIDGKKKDSETFIIYGVTPAETASPRSPVTPAPPTTPAGPPQYQTPAREYEPSTSNTGNSQKQPFAPLDSPLPLSQPPNPKRQ